MTPLSIALSPAGVPYIDGGDEPSAIVAAFERDPGAGLLELGATDTPVAQLDAGARFWRSFGSAFVSRLTKTPGVEGQRPTITVARPDLEALVAAAPPMRGGEYLNQAILEASWVRMEAALADALAHFDGTVATFLGTRSASWHLAGRVCFHLAENRGDDEMPFAFVATYSDHDPGRDRVRHRPLGRALKAYADDRDALLRLLEPVQYAAERCEWVAALVQSDDIYHPLAWSVDEAHAFLRAVPELEDSGVTVRVPDWWRGRASRPLVSATVGDAASEGVGLDALLDFRVDVTVDGEPLTPQEWAAIREAESSLVLLRGRWVEIDRDRLDHVLQHWRDLEQAAADGISLAEGLRLIAGLPADNRASADDREDQDWSEVVAGKALQSALQSLRAPGDQGPSPGRALRATLRPYQKAGLEWLWTLDRLSLGGCLADDMGLGKTLQVIALLLLKRRHQDSAPSLVVVPASLVGNWQSEIAKFAPSLKVLVAHGSVMPKDALKALDATQLAGHDVVITTYGALHRSQWPQAVEWSAVILDEAQAIKNAGTRQTRAAKKLTARTRIALTGTPVENRLADLWSIFDFLNPGLLGSAQQFSRMSKVLAKRERNPYAPLRQLIAPYILRRMKTDATIIDDLPDKVEVDAYCALSRVQAGHYKTAVDALTLAIGSAEGTKRRGLVLAYLMRLKQICNHPSQWLGDGEYAPKQSGKFQRLAAIAEEIESRQERALVFTQFREMTEPLAEFLATVFGRPGLVLHGGTPVKKRRALVQQFAEDRGPPFFVISLKAGGTGLNLTAASHVIHFDRWWNPAVEDQATDRAFRIGQTKNVLVHKLICRGTVEERIDAVIKDKRALIRDVVDGTTPPALTELDDDALLALVALDINRALEQS